MAAKARNWLVTAHYTDSTSLEHVDEQLQGAGAPTSLFHYCRWQFEAGATGHLHIQAYVQCTKQVRLPQLKAALGSLDAHCEKVHNDQAAYDYVAKEESRVCGPYEAGYRYSQGERSDILLAYRSLSENRRLRHLLEAHTNAFVKYTRAWDRVLALTRPGPLAAPRKVIVHWGVPGSGKTHHVLTEARAKFAPEDIHYLVAGNNGLWFDGADSPRCLIVDDFRGKENCHVQLWKLLNDTNTIPTQVDTKHGRIWVNLEVLYWISERNPIDWFDPVEYPGVQRRITTLKYWGTPRMVESPLDPRFGWDRDAGDGSSAVAAIDLEASETLPGSGSEDDVE